MKRETQTRREFLRSTALGGAVTWTVPTFLARTWEVLGAEAADRAVQPVTGRDGTILVVVQLAGGNDALNTVVPFGDDHYRRARPRLGIATKDVLRVGDTLGFHPSLRGLHALFEQGRVAVVPGVGYPNPNRSHFRSMEIWQTASEADRFERHGWIGRYFDHACHGCDPTVGVSVGRQMPQAFTGERPTGVSVEAPGRARAAGTGKEGRGMGEGVGEAEAAMMESDAHAGGSVDGLSGESRAGAAVLDFLDRTAVDARLSGGKVRETLARAKNAVEYPASRLGQSLKTVGQLIAGGLPTRVYYASQGGFDTHTNQAANHGRLLQEFGDGMKAFIDDLQAQGNLGRVRVACFTEFGRRVAENASGGTDHGAGGAMFLLGERFSERWVGRYPSLAPGDLVQGDLRFNVDFRRVYASLLDDWLRTPSEKILGGKLEKLRIA